MRRWTHLTVLALALPVAAGACGGSSSPKGTTSPASTAALPASSGQHVTVTPSSGLTSPATVQVVAGGFSPHESLVVVECANKGSSTGPGDCNLSGLKTVTSSPSGEVDTTFTVIRGPFGADHVVCSAPGSCLVSVSQPTPSPTQEADAPISFA